MTQFGVAVAIAVLAACERADRSEVKPEPLAQPCLADELGLLSPAWSVLEECTADNNECRDACLEGDGDACFNRAVALGERREAGLESREMYKRACQLGLSQGCTNWAAAGWNDNDRSTYPCLYRVFEKACAVKDVFGCGMMSRMLVETPTIPADKLIGYARLHTKCHELKGPPCRFLAYYIELGKLGPPDVAIIKRLMDRACEGGDEEACKEWTNVDDTFTVRDDE